MITLDLNQLPDKARKMVLRLRAYDNDTDTVIVNSGKSVVIHKGFPVIAFCKDRAYEVEAEYDYRQSVSDIAEYSEIIASAFYLKDRDEDTCKMVVAIHDHHVVQLSALTWMGLGDKVQAAERHGRIIKAKFTAVRIWNEGIATSRPKAKRQEPVYSDDIGYY